MMQEFKEFVDCRELLSQLAWKDIRIRYKQSVMGFLWAIFMPALIVISGIIMREAMSYLSGHQLAASDLVSILVKSVPWAFFVAAIRFGTQSLLANQNLVTKVYFPREVFPIAAVMACLFDFVVAGSGVVIVLFLVRISVNLYVLWVPFILLLLVILATGLSLLLSCANLFFRDVKYLVEIFLTFGIFYTPVFYDAASLGKWRTVVLLNPVGSLLEALNTVVVLRRPPDFAWLSYAGGLAVICLCVSWAIFSKAEAAFAESI